MSTNVRRFWIVTAVYLAFSGTSLSLALYEENVAERIEASRRTGVVSTRAQELSARRVRFRQVGRGARHDFLCARARSPRRDRAHPARLRESRGFPRNRCPDRRFDEPSGLSCAGAGTARAGRRFQYVDLRRDQRMVPLAVDSGGDRNRSGSLSGAHQRTRPSGPGDPAGPCGGIPGAYWCSAILTSSASVWPKSSSSRPTLRFCSPPTSPRVEGPSGIRERGALILPGGETLHQLRMS